MLVEVSENRNESGLGTRTGLGVLKTSDWSKLRRAAKESGNLILSERISKFAMKSRSGVLEDLKGKIIRSYDQAIRSKAGRICKEDNFTVYTI